MPVYSKLSYIFFIVSMFSFSLYGQDISLLQQYNGRYDFIFIGNTMNPQENSFMTFPEINMNSSATLNLNANDVIEKAYLYWAGCGPGDLDVKLNNIAITPDHVFHNYRPGTEYFSAFKDITAQVRNTRSGAYTLSDFDLNQWIPYYFQSRTNFGGWAIVVIYKNNALTLNQLNYYHGLQAIPGAINITLNNLNVIDNRNAKIGFLAWEGDKDIAIGETLSINSQPVSNLPLNPANNAFNGTNTFTNNPNLYNMDLDVYDLQSHITIGDTIANIRMTSGQDVVLINAIVTKLNSQLPDAVIDISKIDVNCNSRDVILRYTVSNFQATAAIPPRVPIAIYLNGNYLQSVQTQNQIEIDGSENGAVILTIPDAVASPFDIKMVVDDDGTGRGSLIEIRENNNTSTDSGFLFNAQPLGTLQGLTTCNEGFTKGTFDFSGYEQQIRQNATDIVSFYPTLADLQNDTNIITDPSNYTAPATPMLVYVKVDNGNCFQTTTFELTTKKCAPIIYNFVSANNDGTNDTFHIKGLRDVFLNYKLEVYNRWGKLVWTGNNSMPEWDGFSNQGVRIVGTEISEGTYFYHLDLNDAEYPDPYTGYLFLNH